MLFLAVPEPYMKKYRTIWVLILQWGALWSVIILCSLAWNQHLVHQHITIHAHDEATTIINKDLAFRRWATMHGGVYVNPTDQTPPNPWLSVAKKNITTTDGDKLTLMNPAYMTRQVMELFGEQYGVKGHITSLMAKNPGNSPDAWEKQALQLFEKGKPYLSEQTLINNQPYYRLILPMKMEQGCLKCHAETLIPVGGIRGGISAAVPLKPHFLAAKASLQGIRMAHGTIWLVGMAGIAMASVIYHRQQQRERLSEDELRSQEALYASLTTAAPIGIFHADADGACRYVNDRWTQLSGIPLEKALGDGWIAALHPEDKPLFFSEWQQATLNHNAFTCEYRFLKPDGTVVWVYGQSAEIHDSNGKVNGYVRTVTDITDRKKTEATLAETAMFLKETQNIAHLGGWKLNPVTEMVTCTDEIFLMLNLPSKGPVSKQTFLRHFDPQDMPQVRQSVAAAIEQGTPFNLSCRMNSSSDRQFWAEFRCIGRIDGQDGGYITGTFQDISPHKQIEELLTSAKEMAEATSRTKTELLSTLSHELRTPLNGVVGGAQLMEMTELSAEQQEYLQMIKTSAYNELSMVNDLLDLAGLEASGIKINERSFTLLESIRTAIDKHRHAVASREIRLITSLPDELRQEVISDSDRLIQIIGHLIGNAVKFTRQGSITVSAETLPLDAEHLRLCLKVSDTGIGINPQDRERIFEPFVQADMSNTRKFGGTGLGLAICRRLTERMGGSIRVESQLGEGSCFTLELPLKRNSGEDAVLLEKRDDFYTLPKWEGPHLTILIAEDNDANLKAAAGLLKKMGLKAICAEDGKLALAHWMQGGIDAILMDIQMPVMDGLEATRFIRNREQGANQHTPIIALTAHAMAEDRENFIAAGFDGYVAKPFDVAELTEELARVTQKKG